MTFDPDLLRNLLLRLECRQLSPRSTVLIEVNTEAEMLGTDAFSIISCLNWLLELSYIDGPGEEGGVWLFRKLTQKGLHFVSKTRDPADWAKIKKYYAGNKMA